MTALLRAATAALLLLVLAACGAESTREPDGVIDNDGLHGSALDEPYVVPDIALVDTDSEPFVLAEADADLTLVFFGYTHCPDICGIVMSTIAVALNQLDAADRERVDMVFVTTDPARDDPQTLRAYLDGYDPSFSGATGELDDIVTLARALAVFIDEGKKLPGGGYEVVHSDPVLGLDDQGQVTTVWNKDVSATDLAEDIERLLAP